MRKPASNLAYAKTKISCAVTVTVQAGLCQTCGTPEDLFSRDTAHFKTTIFRLYYQFLFQTESNDVI